MTAPHCEDEDTVEYLMQVERNMLAGYNYDDFLIVEPGQKVAADISGSIIRAVPANQ